MMKKYFFVFLISLFIYGCDQSKPAPEETKTEQITPAANSTTDTTHTTKNSLDWHGTYEGLLPCADCQGIKTRLTLNKNQTYVLEQSYLKNDGVHYNNKEQGDFQFDKENPSLIRLDAHADERVFFIGEGFAQARDKKTGASLNDTLNYKLNQVFTP